MTRLRAAFLHFQQARGGWQAVICMGNVPCTFSHVAAAPSACFGLIPGSFLQKDAGDRFAALIIQLLSSYVLHHLHPGPRVLTEYQKNSTRNHGLDFVDEVQSLAFCTLSATCATAYFAAAAASGYSNSNHGRLEYPMLSHREPLHIFDS